MRMPEMNRRQAMVPPGAVSLPNANGSAPGLLIPAGDKLVVLLPGPPRELQPMLLELCAPGGALGSRAGDERLFKVSIFTTGLSESHVEELAQPIYSTWRDIPQPIETTILAAPGQVELHLTLRSADGPAARQTLEQARARLVAAHWRCRLLHRRPAAAAVRWRPAARARDLTIAAAESCTGGLLLQRLTEVPGSSAYVKGGVIAYSNELKIQLLGVDAALLDAHGAVSEPVAAAMADGMRARTGADISVAITGIAGPDGGTAAKPVGTVVIAILLEGQRDVGPDAPVPGRPGDGAVPVDADRARPRAPAADEQCALFVAAEPSEQVRAAAAACAERLRDRLAAARAAAGIRWVPRQNLHLTVWFLGEVSDPRAAAVLEALRPPLDGAGLRRPHRRLWRLSPVRPAAGALDGCDPRPP